MTPIDIFQHYRPLLLSIATHALGCPSEAEDILQEAWMRWQCADAAAIDSPKAWLTTVVTRLCLDQSRSARARRVECAGLRLEKLGASSEPLDLPRLAQALDVLLERLTPTQRAAYLLQEIFDHSSSEASALLGVREAACRQQVCRARGRLQDVRPRAHVRPHGERPHLSREVQGQLLRAFSQASLHGDLGPLRSMLAATARGGHEAAPAQREDDEAAAEGSGSAAVALRPARRASSA
jgi:RNA polymerase sigma-70 factor (ECF subfamily)